MELQKEKKALKANFEEQERNAAGIGESKLRQKHASSGYRNAVSTRKPEMSGEILVLFKAV